MLYTLLGFLRAAVGRLTAWEYRDSHKGIKRRDEPVNGLYSGFTFWRVLRTDRHKRKNSRLQAPGGPTSGGKLPGSIWTRWTQKTRPRLSQGGQWWYSRFFRRLPDHHKREKDNK